jgi:hypothetical protein
MIELKRRVCVNVCHKSMANQGGRDKQQRSLLLLHCYHFQIEFKDGKLTFVDSRQIP